MKALSILKSALFWLLQGRVPGFVVVFITIAALTVIVSQCSTIGNRNSTIKAQSAAYKQRGDTVRMYETQIQTTQHYYDAALQKQKTELAQIRKEVASLPASKLPAAIADNLRAIDSLLRFYDAGAVIPGDEPGPYPAR